MKRRLLLLLFLLCALSLFIGVYPTSFQNISGFSDIQWLVFFHTRIPRLISLLIVGAATSVCGLVMQQLMQNKFVSPTTAGTMDSAKLGILFVMLFLPQASVFQKSFFAFFFSFLGTVFFLQIVRYLPQSNTTYIPLVGLMFGNIIGSLTTFFAYQFRLIQNMSSWLQGNFSLIHRGNYELIFLTLPLLLLIYFYAHYFTAVGMGKDLATSLGISYQFVQMFGLLLVSLTSAVTLVTVGALPFLDIVVPNVVSLYKGDQLKKSLGLTALSGSIFLVFCDIAARVIIYPYEIPVSLVVGVIGSFLFIGLLWKGAKR